MIITDLIILAYKQSCTRDSGDCQREQNPKRCVGGYIPVFLLPMPCQTHSPFFHCTQTPATCWLCSSSHTARPQDSRKTTAQGCEHVGETKTSSPQRSPLPAHGLGPETALFLYFCSFFPRSSKRSARKQSRRITELLCSDQGCLFHPLPYTALQGLSERLHSQNMG